MNGICSTSILPDVRSSDVNHNHTPLTGMIHTPGPIIGRYNGSTRVHTPGMHILPPYVHKYQIFCQYLGVINDQKTEVNDMTKMYGFSEIILLKL